MIVPEYDPDDPRAGVFSRMVGEIVGMDPRFATVPASRIVAECADPTVQQLLDQSRSTLLSPAHASVDALRACLHPWFREPVVWFDVDMLFTGDVSDVFGLVSHVRVAAAPDLISTLGDRRGSEIYGRFTTFVNDREPGAMRSAVARNIGFMVLAGDTREEFSAGFRLALDFLDEERDPIASFSVGQLAWNYVMEKVRSATLEQDYNMPSACFPVSWDSGPEGTGEAQVRVRHYVGVEQKKRMTLDFALEFADAGRGRRTPDAQPVPTGR
ncbi:hypothetical protein GCM10010430_04430 [Kitasatospora cystarginea]|uniref:Glycosyltransferase n=2 Tax=Kitasatospora TaxID=2063 RepID=A0ABP5Q7B1_9ACTN